MMVLHASLLDRHLRIWGETSSDSVRSRSSRPPGNADSGAPVFPYDGADIGLSDALLATGFAAAYPKALIQPACLWAPTANEKPVPSTPLVAEHEAAGDYAIRPWTVSTVAITSQHAVNLLCSCVDRELLAPGIIIGSTLLYWTTAFRFAAALAARQQFLPSLRKDQDGWRACWEPALLGGDAERAASLARAMPAACRAITLAAAGPPEFAASTVLSAFLALIVDCLARPGGAAQPSARSSRTKAPEADTLHEQWITALRGPQSESVLDGPSLDIDAFARQVAEWRRPLLWSHDAPFGLCLRLEEPPEERTGVAGNESESGWFVRYMLRSVQDPSLQVPADAAWNGKGKGKPHCRTSDASLLQRDGFRPAEYLLTALGQASHVCPEIEASLRSPAPAGFPLDNAGAHQFLTDRAWMLEQAGFGVLLPSWWTGSGTRIKLGATATIKSPKIRANTGLTMESIVQVDWSVALGGEPITEDELEKLARHKASLVRWRGQWVQVDSGEIERAMALWQKRGAEKMTARRAMALALGSGSAPAGLTLERVEAVGWMRDLLDSMEDQTRLEEAPDPPGFRGSLRPYQRRGVSWLRFLGKWGLGACLADDMGLGKTPQTLALIAAQQESGAPVLVVCPTSVVGNWQKEAARFAPDLTVLIHHGIVRKRGEEFVQTAGRTGMVICSFALLYRDYDVLAQIPWAGIVLDEAQNIKNPETKQSKAARNLRAGWRIALTGTPVENHVGDLWAIMEFLNPGLLGGQTEFRRRFFVPIQANRDKVTIDRLHRLTGPFILRRLKTDRTIIADLPEKMEMKTYCTLTREQASLYEAVLKEATGEIDQSEGIQRRGVILATLAKLKQVCNHPAQLLKDRSQIPGRSGKLARLTEMLEEVLEAGEKALIFTQFAEMGRIIRGHLEDVFGRETLFLHGGVARSERERIVELFQSAGKQTPFFILSLKAGGVGLNLTAANHVFHFDRWWNPAVESQATDRAFRIGQTKNVQVYKFVCAGTLEEKIDAMIEAKQDVARSVVGTGEDWITNLSTTQLKEIFALSRDAVAE